jgi:hypothetical protein
MTLAALAVFFILVLILLVRVAAVVRVVVIRDVVLPCLILARLIRDNTAVRVVDLLANALAFTECSSDILLMLLKMMSEEFYLNGK